MADISKITLPSGTTYNIKDEQARSDLDSLKIGLSGAMHYVGVAKNEITPDLVYEERALGSTPKISIIIDDGTSSGKSIDLNSGDVVIYGSMEYIFTIISQTSSVIRGIFHEFGSTGSLKALAFKDSASAAYTPAGTISQPTFTGTKATISAKYTPAGTVAISKGTGTANYTPEGTISAPNITVFSQMTDINAIDVNDGSGVLPSFTATVADETLSLNFNAGKFYDTQKVSVVSNVSATVDQPKFTGTPVELKGSFTGAAGTATASYTPAGAVSKPTFTGTAATITAK